MALPRMDFWNRGRLHCSIRPYLCRNVDSDTFLSQCYHNRLRLREFSSTSSSGADRQETEYAGERCWGISSCSRTPGACVDTLRRQARIYRDVPLLEQPFWDIRLLPDQRCYDFSTRYAR